MFIISKTKCRFYHLIRSTMIQNGFSHTFSLTLQHKHFLIQRLFNSLQFFQLIICITQLAGRLYIPKDLKVLSAKCLVRIDNPCASVTDRMGLFAHHDLLFRFRCAFKNHAACLNDIMADTVRL